jgi:hypothetical protein
MVEKCTKQYNNFMRKLVRKRTSSNDVLQKATDKDNKSATNSEANP